MADIEQEIADLLDEIDINWPAIELELAELWACCEKEWPAIEQEAEKMWMAPIGYTLKREPSKTTEQNNRE